MIRTGPWPKSRQKPLTQQQTDFTSEGSPPPGKVAASTPKMPGGAREPGAPRIRKPAR
ncbi:hypothetical protein [Caldimonas sp. KR1-144]|uniref:hypothetical protein n=1 Tax=Caldimonas sp. KR1-144 TaxID=3400911 RepID=UPI003C2CC32E